jgi:uncharacterized protein DUF4136
VILGAGCNIEPSIEERTSQQIVVTKFDPGASFASYTTFAMPDSIPLFRSLDRTVAIVPGTLTPAIADPMLAEISAQLTSRGYTRVERTQGPDLGVAVTALEVLRAEQVSYGAWWGLGDSSASFWGYGGAVITSPLAYETVAWRSGTIVVELDDLRAARALVPPVPATPTIAATSTAQPTAEITVVWAAILHGVVSPDTATAPIAPLQQAFAQSPYLRR